MLQPLCIQPNLKCVTKLHCEILLPKLWCSVHRTASRWTHQRLPTCIVKYCKTLYFCCIIFSWLWI